MKELELMERFGSFLIAFAIFGSALLILLLWAWVGVVFVMGWAWDFPWWAFRSAIFGGATIGFAFACSKDAVS